MSTTFDVTKWASMAGIQTTGGFAVVAECVTLDELQRFAQIAMESAAIELVKKKQSTGLHSHRVAGHLPQASKRDRKAALSNQ